MSDARPNTILHAILYVDRTRNPVALSTARIPALAEQLHLHSTQQPAAAPGPHCGRPRSRSHGLRHRHPKRQDLHSRTRRQPELQRGQEDRWPHAQNRHRLGLLSAAVVTAAGLSDGAARLPLLTQAAADNPTITKVWADSAYRTAVIEHGATLGIDVKVIRCDPTTKGFTPLPRRWAVERTIGWLMFHRRLVHDYEALPSRSEAMIHIAMIDLMSRRLTGESAPTWHGT